MKMTNELRIAGAIPWNGRVLLLSLLPGFSSTLQAQTTQDRALTIAKPGDVGMSESVLKAATSLYSEAVARGDILGAVLLVARQGKVVLYEATGVRDQERNLLLEKDTPFQI